MDELSDLKKLAGASDVETKDAFGNPVSVGDKVVVSISGAFDGHLGIGTIESYDSPKDITVKIVQSTVGHEQGRMVFAQRSIMKI